MKPTNYDKRQNALDLLVMINDCEVLSDLEHVKHILEDFVDYQYIFKKDYYTLRKKLYDKSCFFIEKGYV